MKDKWIKNIYIFYICTQCNIIQPYKKGKSAIYSNIDGTGGYYAKSAKPEKELDSYMVSLCQTVKELNW